MDTIKLIEELYRLKADGIITDEEFAKSKADVLAGIAPDGPRRANRPASLPRSQSDVVNWIFVPLKKYDDFDGRARRKEFWLFQLPFLIPAAIATSLTRPHPYFKTLGPTEAELAVAGILGLVVLVLLVPQIAVTARRFHDQDLTGWLALLYLIPVIGWLIVFIFMAMPGTAGPNRYGDDPLSS